MFKSRLFQRPFYKKITCIDSTFEDKKMSTITSKYLIVLDSCTYKVERNIIFFKYIISGNCEFAAECNGHFRVLINERVSKVESNLV